MFGNAPKDPNRVQNLISSLRHSNLNLNFASDSFIRNHNKISEFIEEGLASSTNECYFLAFQRYSKFCSDNGFPSLPLEEDVVATYFIYLSEEKQSLASIYTARSALRRFSLVYRPNDFPITDGANITMIVQCAKRRLSKPVKKSKALEMHHLKAIIDKFLVEDHLKSDNFSVNLDHWHLVAKTVVKFHTFARFEEIAALKKSNFEFQENGVIKITFNKAKNNQYFQAKESYLKPSNNLRYCPVNIIKKYFLRINSLLDHFFVPKLAFKKAFLSKPTSYMYCITKYRAALKSIGVVDYLDYGEHSDKIGGLSAALNAGCDLYSLQRHGRWKTDSVVKTYHDQSLSRRLRVSGILNDL